MKTKHGALACCLSTLLSLHAAPADLAGAGRVSAPPDRPFDYYGDIPWEQEQARLDNFAIAIQNEPAALGQIIVFAGRKTCPGEAQARGIRARRYLTERRGVEWDRVLWRHEGFREQLEVILLLVPRGARVQPHYLNQSVPPEEVRFTKSCGVKKAVRQRPRTRRGRAAGRKKHTRPRAVSNDEAKPRRQLPSAATRNLHHTRDGS